MQAFSVEEQAASLEGLAVEDGVVSLQIIARLLAAGKVADFELAAVSKVRTALVEAIQEATGANYDQRMMELQAALAKAQNTPTPPSAEKASAETQ